MTDQGYIRKAVELADGWKWIGRYDDGIDWAARAAEIEFERLDTDNQFVRDALVAQLVRQADAIILYRVRIEPTGTFIDHEGTGERIADSCLAGGRTMNTTKVIVDSKILE